MFEERQGLNSTDKNSAQAASGPLFALGQVVATPGALHTLEQAGESPLRLLGRHAFGDWGDLDEEDLKSNDEALRSEGRLLSAYRLETGQKVWIITEWDRSQTTLLLPSEY